MSSVCEVVDVSSVCEVVTVFSVCEVFSICACSAPPLHIVKTKSKIMLFFIRKIYC